MCARGYPAIRSESTGISAVPRGKRLQSLEQVQGRQTSLKIERKKNEKDTKRIKPQALWSSLNCFGAWPLAHPKTISTIDDTYLYQASRVRVSSDARRRNSIWTGKTNLFRPGSTYVYIYILYLHWDNSNLWLHLSRRKDLNRAMSESRWISLSLKCYGFSHITKHTTPSGRFTALMGCFLMMFAEKRPCRVPNMPSICTGWHVVLGRKCLNDTNSSEW